MALATCGQDGLPNVRMVLLKEIEAGAFVFYTNYGSTKAHELASNGRAAFAIHWKSLRRQIRARGPVEKEDGSQADRYFASRPPDSRHGAWASRQSTPIAARDELESRLRAIKSELGPDPARPPFWGGFRLVPVEIEFWCEGRFRLHDRFRWSRRQVGEGWNVARLAP